MKVSFPSTNTFVFHLMLSELLNVNSRSQPSLLTPPPPTVVYQTPTDSSGAEHAWLGKANADTVDLQMRSDRPPGGKKELGFNPELSITSAPAYMVLNCRSARVTYIHISLPVSGWHFHGNRSRLCTGTGWSWACVSACMSVWVHLCLPRLQQWQSPNWIRAYGKAGGGSELAVGDHGRMETQ